MVYIVSNGNSSLCSPTDAHPCPTSPDSIVLVVLGGLLCCCLRQLARASKDLMKVSSEFLYLRVSLDEFTLFLSTTLIHCIAKHSFEQWQTQFAILDFNCAVVCSIEGAEKNQQHNSAACNSHRHVWCIAMSWAKLMTYFIEPIFSVYMFLTNFQRTHC